jgi:hypothetical protein
VGRRARRRSEGGGAQSARSAGAGTAPGAQPPGSRAGEPAAGDDPAASRSARTEARNAAARAKLVPLREGERPRAVTVALVVVLALAALNIGSYLAGVQLAGGGPPPLVPLAAYTLLLLVTAYGLWRARYWAVLGTQAVLVLWILVLSLSLVTMADVFVAAITVLLIAGAGTLFWFLVKAMARIQMPGR